MRSRFTRDWTARLSIRQIHSEHLSGYLWSVSRWLLTRKLLGDVGGQRTLRPYWRNYFEQTDALVWVVDSGDRMRMKDCKEELHSLLMEDVCIVRFVMALSNLTCPQRLAGASLLIFANKQDIQGSMTEGEICDVSSLCCRHMGSFQRSFLTGTRFACDHNASLEDFAMQRSYGREPGRRP